MSKKRVLGILLVAVASVTVAGCDIHYCESDGDCIEPGADKSPNRDAADHHDQCVQYCGRVSVCGGEQAADIDVCASACEKRFVELPRETAELCACAEQSRCSDVVEGRCSTPPVASGAGGSSSMGFAGQAGTPSSSQGGAACGGANAGGATATGGTDAYDPGHATGGAPISGGGASDAGACTCDCDCAAGMTCISGFCR